MAIKVRPITPEESEVLDQATIPKHRLIALEASLLHQFPGGAGV